MFLHALEHMIVSVVERHTWIGRARKQTEGTLHQYEIEHVITADHFNAEIDVFPYLSSVRITKSEGSSS